MSVKPLPLREWVAQSYLNAPVQGTTRPLFYQCVADADSHGGSAASTETFLVKALSDQATMAREIVGNRIAQVAGLQTPEPAVVLIPTQAAEQVNAARRSEGKYADQRPGQAAGARLFNAWNVMELSEVPERLREAALRLYTFDMMALHTDRTVHNPNCAATSEGLLVYDFERCFVEDDEADEEFEGGDEWPVWLRAEHGLGWLHMFYTGLQGAKSTREIARQVVDEMTDQCLERCLEDLPEPWRSEGERIASHVKLIKNHADEFVESVVRSLGT